MALTKCKECGKEISTEAISCPSCGAPQKSPVTIEATGKKWKKLTLASVMALLVGIFLIFMAAGSGSSSSAGATAGIGVLLTLGGIVGYLAARFGSWWHHG